MSKKFLRTHITWNFLASFCALGLIVSAVIIDKNPELVYANVVCSDFNFNSSSCNSTPNCSYPGNLGACSAFTDNATCSGNVGCIADNSGDCSILSDGGGDGSTCATQSQCSYDTDTGTCSGNYFLSCSGNYDDGSCVGSGPVYGCTDSNAYNYNPSADYDDGSCIAKVFGCTDSLANNYNPSANTDDGSCSYSAPDLVSFTSTTTDSVYGVGSQISVFATFNKAINSGTIELLLNSGATTTLNITTGSTKLYGIYTVQPGESSADLAVTNIVSANINDNHGNYTSFNLPSINIDDASNIVVVGSLFPSPVLLNGSQLTLVFNTDLDQSSVPIAGDFSITSNSTPITVSSLSLSSRSLTLNLSSRADSTTQYFLNYIPGLSPLRDVSGNLVDTINNFEINNIGCNYIDAGSGPFYSAVYKNKVYINNSGNHSVTVIDSYTDSVLSTIQVGNLPTFSRVVGNQIYVLNTGSNSVSVINADNDTVTATIPVGNGPTESILVGTKLLIPSFLSDKISIIDTLTNTVSSSVSTTNPFHLAVVGNKLYVTQTSSAIDVFDVNTFDLLATIAVSSVNLGEVTTSGNRLYISDLSNSNMVVVDTDTDSIISTVLVGASPIYPKVVGDKLYVTNAGDDTVSVIDRSNNSVIQTLHVGRNPDHNILIGNKLYINNENFDEQLVPNSGSVSVIDTNTDTVIKTVQLGANPYYISAVGNKLYIPNHNSNNVSVIDTNDDSVVNTCAPRLTSFTSTTNNGIFTTGDSVNITANFDKVLGSGSRMRLVLNTGRIINLTNNSGTTLTGIYTIGSGDSVPDLSIASISNNPSFTVVFDTSSSQNSISSFVFPLSPDLTGDDLRNLGDFKDIVVGSEPLTIPTDTNPYQMVTIGNLTYVANQGSNNVTIFDNTNYQGVDSPISVGSQPYGMAYNSISKEIYVANLKGNSVSVIDVDPANTSTYNTVTHTITSGMGIEPYYVTSLGSKIYVTNNLSWTVSEIDTATHSVTGTIRVGTNPRGIKAMGNKLYVANFGSNYGGQAQGTLSVIDTANANSVSTIDVGSGPRGVAVNGTDVYVANFNDGTVSRINTASGDAVTTISVGKNPRGILALNNKIYVENYQDGTISIIDGTTHSVSGPYKVGNTPSGMAAIGNNIAISRFTDDVVSIFDTTNLALVALTQPDTTPPAISSIASSTAQTTATVSWSTDEAATSTLTYGLTTSYGSLATSSVATTTHTFDLSGLANATTYHFRITSSDSSGNATTTSDYTFSTLPAILSQNTSTPVSAASTAGSSITTSLPQVFNVNNNANKNNNSIGATSAQSLPVFTSTFKQGDTGNTQILNLQKFLNSYGFPVAEVGAGSPGRENQNFGLRTKKALISFQIKHGIKPATGVFGPITKKVINDIILNSKKNTTSNVEPTPACNTAFNITTPIKFGQVNNSEDVKSIETFLNQYEGARLPIDGVYAKSDYDAVVKFQEKYASAILSPWGIKRGTGYVSANTINQIKKVIKNNCK